MDTKILSMIIAGLLSIVIMFFVTTAAFIIWHNPIIVIPAIGAVILGYFIYKGMKM